MPGSLMLINPRKRRRARKTSSARRRRRSSPALFSNPVARYTNPRRRRRSRRHNPIRVARRRNPINVRSLQTTAMDAFKGASGAILVNVAMRQLSPMLPAALSTGYGRYATRAGLAIGIGLLGKKLIGESLARKMAEGALTVLATNLVCEVAAGSGLDLTGIGYYSPAQNVSLPMARDLRPRLNGIGRTGEYTSMPNVASLRRGMSG